MGVTLQEFWRLVVSSGLYDEAQCRRLADAFAKAKQASSPPGPGPLPEWLVAQRVLTRYQAKILLAGRPGPFVFGDYIVAERIDADERAGLFRAVHRPSGVSVCLKFLSGPTTAHAALMQALVRQCNEAAALSRHSPFLVHCHTLVDGTAYKFYVVEDLSGASLRARLAKDPTSPLGEAALIVRQIAAGLLRWHQDCRPHGAVRPDRIWLAAGAAARLMGVPLNSRPEKLSSTEFDAAEIDYWPPELAAGVQPTLTGDIYSFGCTVYHLLTGQVPFPGADAAQRRNLHRASVPRPIDQINPAVSPELAALVAKMLAKKPAARFADAIELSAALATTIEGRDAAQGTDDATVPTPRATLDNWLSAHGQASQPAAVSEVVDSASSVAVVIDDHEPVRPATSAARPAVPVERRKKFLLGIGASATTLLLVGGAMIYFFIGGRNDRGLPISTAVVPAGPATPDVAPANSSVASDPGAATPAKNDGTPPATGDATAGASPPVRGAPGGEAGETVVAVDGVMWASPTHGRPLDLAYLAPGAAMVVVLRPADLLARPEGERLLDPRTSGALGTWLTQRVPAETGVPLANMEQLIIGVLVGSDRVPRLTLVVRAREALVVEQLRAAWGDPTAEHSEEEKADYYRKGDQAYYLPADAQGRVLVVGPVSAIVEDVIPVGAHAPPLRREMEILLAASDTDRDLTVLIEPGVILVGSEAWFPGNAIRIRRPLDWFLSGHEPGEAPSAPTPAPGGGNKQRSVDLSSLDLPPAVLVSAHMTDQDLFCEVRITAETNRPLETVVKDYRGRVDRLPQRIKEFVKSLALSDYSRDVLLEFPWMVDQLARHTVAGTDGRQVVLRAYLPVVAAHNLAIGSHLALLENPRGVGGPAEGSTANEAAPVAAAPPPQEPVETVAQRLDRKITVTFDRNPLERALAMVGEEIGVTVIILGKDLQVEGITKNKSFGLAEQDKPAREILQKIMLNANSDGKLVYVVKPVEGGTGEALYVTTRAAAKERGDTLPPEFAE